jgi:hypothetical protein
VDLARAQRARAEAGAAVAKEASDIARHNKAGAYLEALRATRDLAKAAHYQAEITRHEASAKRDEARSRRDAARSRKEKARERRDKTKARTVGLPGPARPGEWILGGNDRVPDCAAAAVANSLLAATGWRASDDDVIDLYCRAGGTTVQAALRAAERFGLGSMRPSGFGSLPGPDTPEDGFLVELELEEAQLDQGTWDWEPSPVLGEHAVYLAGGQVVSWGFATPVTGVFLTAQVTGAWWVRWK